MATILNNGYPYLKTTSKSTTVDMTVAVQGASSFTWQKCAIKEGSYENIGNGGNKDVTFAPVDGYWYRCVVDGKPSKSVRIIKAGGSVYTSLGRTLKISVSGGWYVTNETAAYIVNSSVLDVIGLYEFNGQLYWVNTAFSKGWEAGNNPSTVSGGGFKTDEELRFAFLEDNPHAVLITFKAGSSASRFSLGADVMLGDSTITNYADNASLKAVFDGNNLQQIQMVGARSVDEAEPTNPALVLKVNNKPSSYWIGYWSSRVHFSYNRSSDSYLIKEDPNDPTIVSEIQGTDSGMTLSWDNIPANQEISFTFGVGSAEDTGAEIKTSVVIMTNGKEGDTSGGSVTVSKDKKTITAIPNQDCKFLGFFVNEYKINATNYIYFGLVAFSEFSITISEDVDEFACIAKFLYRQNTITIFTNDVEGDKSGGDCVVNEDGSHFKTTVNPESQFLNYYVGDVLLTNRNYKSFKIKTFSVDDIFLEEDCPGLDLKVYFRKRVTDVHVFTNNIKDDESAATFVISNENTTIDIIPVYDQNYYFDGFYDKDGNEITEENYQDYQIKKFSELQIVLEEDSFGIYLEIKFSKHFTVTYLCEIEDFIPEVYSKDGERGVDDGSDGKGHAYGSAYIVQDAAIQLYDEEKKRFMAWNVRSPKEGYGGYTYPGESLYLDHDLTLYGHLDNYPWVYYKLRDNPKTPIIGTKPKPFQVKPFTEITLPTAKELGVRKSKMILVGWSRWKHNTETVYKPGEKFTMDVHKETFYAVWEPDGLYPIMKEPDITKCADVLKAYYINMIKFFFLKTKQTMWPIRWMFQLQPRLAYYGTKYGRYDVFNQEDCQRIYTQALEYVIELTRSDKFLFSPKLHEEWTLENMMSYDWIHNYANQHATTAEAVTYLKSIK